LTGPFAHNQETTDGDRTHTASSTPKAEASSVPALDAKLDKGPGKIGVLAFGVVLIIGVIYAGSSLASDLSGVHNTSILPYLLLGLALLVAMGFEFVNGFHDTANAVATVIYTHSLEPHIVKAQPRKLRQW